MDVPDARRLKQLEEENRALQADSGRPGAESPSREGSLGKKVVTPSKRRIAVTEARKAARCSGVVLR